MAEDLNKIFDTLKPLLMEYVPPFTLKEPSEAIKRSGKKALELVSEKDVFIFGRQRQEVYFAGLIVQKKYVAFYYMLVYEFPKILDQFSPEFQKMLHGKSCFYIKDSKPETVAEVEKALKLGFEEYKKRGWV